MKGILKNKKYILLDLDGTVADSAEGIIKSAKNALRYFGIDVEDSELYSFIGPPLRESFKKYANLSEDQREKALEIYRQRYRAVGWTESKPYAGIPELVKELKAQGRFVALASAKPEPFCTLILKQFGILEYFDYVGAALLDGSRDDKAAIIRLTLENLGNPPLEDVIMVGDRNYDVEGAHKTGVQCVGAKYGYSKGDELKECGAEYIADSVAELSDMLIG